MPKASPVADLSSLTLEPEPAPAAREAVAPAPKAKKPASVTAREEAEAKHQKEIEDRKAEFVRNVMEARRIEPVQHKPQPVPPRVAEQTRLEMEAGRKMNEVHAENLARNPRPQKSTAELAAEGGMTEVFRPEKYMTEKGNVSKGLSTQNAPLR